MNRFSQAVALSLLLTACATSDEGKSKDVAEPTPRLAETPPPTSAPIPTPKPKPPAAGLPTPAIASVQMAQDCPSRKQSQAASLAPSAGASAKPVAGAQRQRRGRRADGVGLRQPCTQSTMQISLSGGVATGSTVTIKELRVLTTDGKQVGTVTAREPTLWKADGYAPWDGKLTSEPAHKASYYISVPDWGALEKAIGKSSYNVMFTLEADIDVGGTVTTVKSPQFERTQPMMIRT